MRATWRIDGHVCRDVTCVTAGRQGHGLPWREEWTARGVFQPPNPEESPVALAPLKLNLHLPSVQLDERLAFKVSLAGVSQGSREWGRVGLPRACWTLPFSPTSR